MATRAQNEEAFSNWEEFTNGGRRYWRDRPGGDFGWCRYVKIVDENEQTVSFTQEIYDDENGLIEIHQKYPVDTGHQYLKKDDEDD